MALGRIKKPPEVLAAQGVHSRARGDGGRGLQPPSVTATPPPRCPTHLTGVARKEWRRIIPSLWESGLVGSADVAGLEMYCASYARWREAHDRIQTEGLVTDGRLGLGLSPWLRVLDLAETQVQKWAAKYGLSTKDRAAMGESLRAISAAKAQSEQDAAAAKPKPRLVSDG